MIKPGFIKLPNKLMSNFEQLCRLPNERRLSVFFLSSILAIAFCAAGCGASSAKTDEKDQGEIEAARQAETPISVSTAKAESREVPSYIAATGTLQAAETSDVAPKVAGQVIATPVNVGAFIRQGEIIARLDDKNARLQLQQAQSAVSQAQSGVVQAQAGVSQAEARLGLSEGGNFQTSAIPEVRAASANFEQVRAELRQAEANEERYRDLVTTGDVSIQVYEGYRTARDTARARLNNAQQGLEAARNAARQNNQAVKSAQAAVEAARTNVESTRTGVATAQKAIDDAIVRAPFAGFVSNRPVALGEFVTTATPIITLLRTSPLKLQITVPEKEAPFIRQGMGVSLEVDAFRDRKFSGVVSAINPLVDQASRAATIEATVENSDNSLRSGMFATARIVREGGNTSVFVPRAAVLSDENTQSYRAFVIQDGIAKLRVVQIGTEENGTIQIVNGINNDETVATSNLEQLFEGAKVK